MKGYKAFNKDLICRGMQYEIGQTYEMQQSPMCCKRGYHFCKNIADVYKYYSMSDDTRICEVVATGEIVTDDDIKYCTNKIKIVREIKNEKIKHCNTDGTIVGYCNSGDYNSGNCNSGDWNSGYCNTDIPKVRLFNHQTDLSFDSDEIYRFRSIMAHMPKSYTYSDFIDESLMTDEEKIAHPEYKVTGGYVRNISVTGDKWKWWNEEVSDEDKDFIRSLPYYDEDIFFESMGIKNDMPR